MEVWKGGGGGHGAELVSRAGSCWLGEGHTQHLVVLRQAEQVCILDVDEVVDNSRADGRHGSCKGGTAGAG